MKEFKLNQDTYFLPESWEEVKYNQYVEIVATHLDTELAPHEKAAKQVSILTHIPLETINEAGIHAVTELYPYLKFLSTEPEVKSNEHVTINNITYYAAELTKFGELAAYDKVETHFKDAELEKTPHILAIFLRKKLPFAQYPANYTPDSEDAKPLLEKFKPEIQEKQAKLFENQLNAVQAKGLAAFFLQKEQLSRQTIPTYSKRQYTLLLLKKRLEILSALDSAGMPVFTKLKKMLLSIGNYTIRKFQPS